MAENNIKKKILAVFGTRPEAIKMCPLIIELRKRYCFDVRVVLTGQHRELLAEVMKSFGVKGDYDLDIMREGQDLFDITCSVISGLRSIFIKEAPDRILVHGDTTTAFCASLAAFYLGIPTGHVEAGLRTSDIKRPFPEEFNRRAISLTADLHFAPTSDARLALIKEGKGEKSIFVTGNTVVDALGYTVKKEYSHPILDAADGRKLIFLTLHRRENQGMAMTEMLRAVRDSVERREDACVVFPVHPSPAVKGAAERELSGYGNIFLSEPLSVEACHNILARSFCVLTDSGGICEEAVSLGRPVLVLREESERRAAVECCGSRVVGTRSEDISAALEELLSGKKIMTCKAPSFEAFGDGKASLRIADVLEFGRCSEFHEKTGKEI